MKKLREIYLLEKGFEAGSLSEQEEENFLINRFGLKQIAYNLFAEGFFLDTNGDFVNHYEPEDTDLCEKLFEERWRSVLDHILYKWEPITWPDVEGEK
jgi:hypothetical protein